MIFSSRDTRFKKPFGAVTDKTRVEYYIELCDTNEALFALRKDGCDTPSLFAMEKTSGGFCVSHEFEEEGLYFYWFEIDGGRKIVNSGSGDGAVIGDNLAVFFAFQQTVYSASYKKPEGFGNGIMYQIMPDRFNIGGKIRETPFSDRRIHKSTEELPEFRPNEFGKITNSDYFGGNFEGIEQKLPYLHSLGVTCIYLNPIFEAHTNHRYDTANYMNADPLLGTNEEFSHLCAEAKKLDIKIILDGVFSHTGADSKYFNKNGRYEDIGAYQSTDSKYAAWYKFRSFPDDYVGWWGFDTLPEVQETNEDYRRFICGEDGVIDTWIKRGASGFRLDVADELPDSFIENIRSGAKLHSQDTIVIGEVWEDASNKISYGERRRFLYGHELDTVMNYPFRSAIISFLKDCDANAFMQSVMTIVENYPKPMLDIAMNMLGTHDTERAMTGLVLDCGSVRDRALMAQIRLSRDEYLRGVELMKLAYALLYTLPGIPCIYYGDEIGMQGFGDPFCRAFYSWKNADENLRAFTTSLGKIRRGHSAFADGEFIPMPCIDGSVSFMRKNSEECMGICVNRGETTVEAVFLNKSFSVAPWSSIIEIIDF
ncbi:MAG: glycoside hydrolase family 13 protein [Oscillospiraceae bacterium]